MKSKQAVDCLGALASESRLALYRLLVKRGPRGFTPSELSERLEIPGPTLSFHLKELVRAELLAYLQRSVPLHRQLGAQHIGRESR
jgi:DNA-binding transcriptional ArsR family regulator